MPQAEQIRGPQVEARLACLARREKGSVFGIRTGNASEAIMRTSASMSEPWESLEQSMRKGAFGWLR